MFGESMSFVLGLELLESHYGPAQRTLGLCLQPRLDAAGVEVVVGVARERRYLVVVSILACANCALLHRLK